MKRKRVSDDILSQIRSCLDAAVSQPGLVRASVHQTEGYLQGLKGEAWVAPTSLETPEASVAGRFLRDIRSNAVAVRGRIKASAHTESDQFLRGFLESFPQAKEKHFLTPLSKLWARWNEANKANGCDAGRETGLKLREEYEEGTAGELLAYLLDDRIHLRNVRDYLRMRGWLQGHIEYLRRKADWTRRELAQILSSNFSSIILRALHNGNVNYAAEAATKLPAMIADLDRATAALSIAEPEAFFFLRKNRQTILTRALHSGYFSYPEEAARDLPLTLRELNARIGRLEGESPDAARDLRENLPSLVYRALTNGNLDSL